MDRLNLSSPVIFLLVHQVVVVSGDGRFLAQQQQCGNMRVLSSPIQLAASDQVRRLGQCLRTADAGVALQELSITVSVSGDKAGFPPSAAETSNPVPRLRKTEIESGRDAIRTTDANLT